MKLVSFSVAGRQSWGVATAFGVIDMGRRVGNNLPTLRSILADDALSEVARQSQGIADDYAFGDVLLLPPVPNPQKVICIGLNYKAHVGEGGGDLPEFPSLFTRFADTLVGHESPITLPKVSGELDYECEVAVVIGRAGRHIRAEDAMHYVAGYSCFNDALVRDYQIHHSLPAGKNFFGTAPFGPWLVTTDEIADPGNLFLRTLINGTEFQHGNTRDLIFDIPTIIAYVSGFTPLAPGDVISTGTPEGVGFLRQRHRDLQLIDPEKHRWLP